MKNGLNKGLILNRFQDHEITSRIIYRDALIIGFNKPPGLPVHNAGGSNHNLEQYTHLLQFGLKAPPVLAHRLDKGTSGCLILARNTHAARLMRTLLEERRIEKTYIALVRGVVDRDSGVIDVNLAKRSPLKKHWWMKADKFGKYQAITEYQVIKRFENQTLLRLHPKTGRTHQLRVHCAYLGHEIIGDYIYARDIHKEKYLPLHLHAQKLTIPLYKNKDPLILEAPLPCHFNSISPKNP